MSEVIDIVREVIPNALVYEISSGVKSNWEPKLFMQTKKEKNCGQYCVAMITHIPPEVIIRELKKGSTYVREMEPMLRWFGVECSFTPMKYIKGMILPDLCILAITGHWCIYFKGYIYCPDIGKVTFEEYISCTRKFRIQSFFKLEIPKV